MSARASAIISGSMNDLEWRLGVGQSAQSANYVRYPARYSCFWRSEIARVNEQVRLQSLEILQYEIRLARKVLVFDRDVRVRDLNDAHEMISRRSWRHLTF